MAGAPARRVRALLHTLSWRRRRRREGPPVPLSFDMEHPSGTLIVAFGGMAGQLGMPPFEFFKATGEIPVKRLFVRDLHQAWYHRGIPGYASDLTGAAEALRELLSGHEIERLVAVGNSAGGYGALALGTLLGADVVLCFAPQTVLDLALLDEWGDHRWDEQLIALSSAGAIDERWRDLQTALPAARRSPTSYEVYYDATMDSDRRHAERLAGIAGMTLNPLQGGEHDVALMMRNSGELATVLRRALLPGAASA